MVIASSLTSMSMFANLYKMQQSGEYCDVEIVTGSGEKFLAHSCILAASSSKFAAMLKKVGSSHQNIKKISIEKEIESSEFQFLLHVIYNCQFVCGDATTNISESGAVLPSTLLQDVSLDRFIEIASTYFSINVADPYKKDGKPITTDPPERRKSLRKCAKKIGNIQENKKRPEKIDGAPQENTKVRDTVESGEDDAPPPGAKISPSKKDQVGGQTKRRSGAFPCTTCRKTFKLRSAWQQHAKKCRSNNNPMRRGSPPQRRRGSPSQRSFCVICGKSFTNSYVMQLHVRTHTGDELYSCDICDKKFPYKSSLSTHRLIHSGVKAYICSVCGKSFTQKVHAKEHESQHAGLKRFSCLECDKHFAHKSGLARHVADIHQQSRPFVCDMCGRCFPRKNKLIEHCRTHTGEKPYICNICGSSYKANRSLKLHKRSQHGIIVPAYQVGICPKGGQRQRTPSGISRTPSCSVALGPTSLAPPPTHMTPPQPVFPPPGPSTRSAVMTSTGLLPAAAPPPAVHQSNMNYMKHDGVLYPPGVAPAGGMPLPPISAYDVPMTCPVQMQPAGLEGMEYGG